MQTPIEITWRGVAKTDNEEDLVHNEMAKLDRLHDNIISAAVAIEQPLSHQRTGSPWRVRIELNVPPGHKVVASQEPGEGALHEALGQSIRAVFRAAGKQLKALAEKQRGEVKGHPDQLANAVVLRVFRDAGYGFVKTFDDELEVYVHQNSVVGDDFDRMEPGTGVHVLVDEGEDGPKASSLKLVDKPGVRAAHNAPRSVDVPPGWNR